jgi:hypothetical protein
MLRFDYVFSYWIFIWYLFYELKWTSYNPKLALSSWIKCLKVDGLLVLEHSRSHGKSRTNRQDPFGVETEILPFLIMGWFSANLRLEGIYEPSKPLDNANRYFVFSKKL